MTKPFQEHLSKIKDVFIELHRYTFFHSPSRIDQKDRRFVGRRKLLSKLKTVLTNTETKSGAYLITGFRGMGKTSLVNAVLKSIQGKQAQFPTFGRVLRIWIFLFVATFFGQFAWDTTSCFLAILGGLFIGVCLGHLYQNSSKKHDLRQVQKPSFTDIIAQLVKFDRHKNTSNSSITLSQDVLIFCFTLLIGQGCLLLCRVDPLVQGHFLVTYSLFLLGFFGYAWGIDRYLNKLRLLQQQEQYYSPKFLLLPTLLFLTFLGFLLSGNMRYVSKLFFGLTLGFCFITFANYRLTQLLDEWRKNRRIRRTSLVESIKKHINYGQNIHIRINLAQDDLTEKEVLRAIAKNIYSNYRNWNRALFPVKKFVWRAALLLFIYCFTFLTYYYKPFYFYVNDIKIESGYLNYFPSQALFLLSDEDSDEIDKRHQQYIRDLNGDNPTKVAAAKQVFSLHTFIKEIDDFIIQKGLAFSPSNKQIPTPQKGIIKAYKPEHSIRNMTLSLDVLIYTFYLRFEESFLDVLTGRELDNEYQSGALKNNSISAHFHLIPIRLDYCFWVFFFSLWGLFGMVKRIAPFGLKTHQSILHDLRLLIDNIDANIMREELVNLPAFDPGGGSRLPLLSRRYRRNYPILEAKAIEKRIIEILKDIDEIPAMTVRPRFILIFDELDKIEPRYNVSISDKEEEVPNLSGLSYYRTETSRNRQEIIAKILANLKHFLNTAKAKFIFIAGREMFDASLADISDRDSSIGSIFHEVFYVNSFFTDFSDGRATDITSMAELYVCQFLMPEDTDYDKNLEGYNAYLKEALGFHEAGNPYSLADQKRIKIIYVLHSFITYLAYRSNGAPKKLTSLFERYVLEPEPHELHGKKSENLIVGRSSNNLFLRFGYYDQYRFGFTTYLFTPFLMTVSHHINDLGDKLLVSTSFLMDHLYKFHNFGFSYRNLELTPEIVAVNKAPQLREFIADLIHFLSGNHIREILSGLYQFKFNRKIVAEIKYISKISEDESAAFNFTLDESLQIKRHYRKKLEELKADYRERDLTNVNHIHSVSFLYMILGDLHFHDQEYDDAILQYMEAVQLLRNVEVKNVSVYQFVLLVRNMLKLGLTFERKRTYDSAYMIYSTLTSYIIGMREVDLKPLGLKEFVLKKEDVSGFIKEHETAIRATKSFQKYRKEALEKKGKLEKDVSIKNYINDHFKVENHEELHKINVVGKRRNPMFKERIKRNPDLPNDFIVESYHEAITEEGIEFMGSFEGFSNEFFSSTIEQLRLDPAKESVFLKKSFLEGLRLIYQPLLAKLQIIEKGNLGGITNVDVERSEREFDFIIRAVEENEKYLIRGEYLNKVGDILYYKNGFIAGLSPEGTKEKRADVRKFCLDGKTRKSIETVPDYKAPFSAYLRYIKGLYLMTQRVIKYEMEEEKLHTADFLYQPITMPEANISIRSRPKINIRTILHDVIGFYSGIDGTAYPNYSSTFYKSLANSLIDVGDTLLCFASKDTPIRPLFLKELFNFKQYKTTAKTKVAKHESVNKFRAKYLSTKADLSLIEEAMCCYYFSGLLFARASAFRQYISQTMKMLNLLIEYEGLHDSFQFEAPIATNTTLIGLIKTSILKDAINATFKLYEHGNRPEIAKLRNILGIKREYNIDITNAVDLQMLYNISSVSSDLRELVMLYAGMELKTADKTLNRKITLENCPITPYSTITKKYNRVFELNFKTKLNYKLLKEDFGFAEIIKEMKSFTVNDTAKKEALVTKLENWLKPNTPISIFQSQSEALEYFIVDSIFCLSEILKSHSIFGINYIPTNYSVMGIHYERMGFWCELSELYKATTDRRNAIETRIEEVIDALDLYHLSPWYNYEMALNCCYRIREVHNEGKAYQQMLDNMYYLDDDFNDSLLHFSIALERYKLNTGKIRAKINRLKKKLKGQPIYEYDTFIINHKPNMIAKLKMENGKLKMEN